MLKLFSLIPIKKGILLGALFFLVIQVLCTMNLPRMMAEIIDNGIAKSDLSYISEHSIYMILIAISSGIGAILSTILTSLFASSIGHSIREKLFLKVQSLSLSEMQDLSIPSLITRSTSDVNIVQRTWMAIVMMILPAPIMALTGLFLAFKINLYIGLIIIGVVVVFSITAILLGKKSIPLFLVLQSKMDRITHILRELISGVKIIRAFNKQNYEKRRFDDASKDYCSIAVRINKIFAILIPFLLLIANIGIVVILSVSQKLTYINSMQIGDIFAAVEYLTIVLWGTMMALFIFMEIPRAHSCSLRILEVLNKNNNLPDTGTTHLTNKKVSHFEFRNVTFKYPGAEEPVLDNISFEANCGQTVAIIGSTGSGKSTIANIILRFFDVAEGQVLINGINIKDMSQYQLRDLIGYVPQQSLLFKGTIESNLKFGNKDATMEDMQHAISIAQASKFINKLDKGYQSFVAQGGKNFSGGQKQRLSIARAIIKKPAIYLFDDSMSALDYKTDLELRQALYEETRESIVFIIAQRVNTIKDADKIIVLDDSKIIGMGTHESLLESCEIYKQIADSQIQTPKM